MSGNGLAAAVEMLGLGEFGADEELTPDMFEPEGAPVGLVPAQRGVSGSKGGRPKGARNKSTEEWRQYILSRYQSPLIGLAEIWSRSPEVLARDLGLKRHVTHGTGDFATTVEIDDIQTAAAMQMQARIAALPYLHQRLPQAIEIKQETRGLMIIGSLDLPQGAATGLALPLAPPEENQGVSDTPDAKSHDAKSHDATNTLTNKDETSHGS